jgi:hypothetical protein
MGGKSTKEIEMEITNEISSNFSNMTHNINDMVNSSITNISNTIINETATEINQATGGANIFRLSGGLNMSGDSVFNVNQTVDVKATNQAVVNIVNDTEMMKDLQSKITSEVMNKIMNDSAAQSQLKAVNELTNKKVNEGGDALIAKAMDAFNSFASTLTGGETREDISQKITNKITTNIQNTTINENIIKNIIENNIETIIKNVSKNSCIANTSTSNEIVIDGGVRMSGKATANFSQVANVVALNSCLIDQSNKVKIAEKLATSTDILATNDTTNKNKAEAKMDVENKAENADEQKSALVAGMDAMKWVVIAIVIAVAIGGCVLLFFVFKTNSSIFGSLFGKKAVAKTVTSPALSKFLRLI